MGQLRRGEGELRRRNSDRQLPKSDAASGALNAGSLGRSVGDGGLTVTCYSARSAKGQARDEQSSNRLNTVLANRGNPRAQPDNYPLPRRWYWPGPPSGKRGGGVNSRGKG